MKQLYEKVNGKFIPSNDPCALEGLSNGVHMVFVQGGSVSIDMKFVPSWKELDAALHYLREGMVKAMSEKSKMRLHQSVKMSPKEIKAWAAYKKTMGKEIPRYFEYPSHWDIADAGIEYIRKIMIECDMDVKKIKKKCKIKERKFINSILSLSI